MNKLNPSYRALFVEGLKYGLICFLSYSLALYFYLPLIENQLFFVTDSLKGTLFIVPVWLLSSFLFARIQGEDSAKSFAKYLFIGFLNFALISAIFVLYFMFIENLEAVGLNFLGAIFIYLWNVFSGGSSDFLIAFFALIPTILIFALLLGFMSVGLNALFYTFTKPLGDRIFKEKQGEK